MSANIPYTEEEDQIIRDGYTDGLTDRQIAAALTERTGVLRTRSGVEKHRRAGLRLVWVTAVKSAACATEPLSKVRADSAFQAAMLRAARAGSENVTQGTFVDATHGSARRYHPEPMMSGCGSSAALAAEMGAHSGIE